MAFANADFYISMKKRYSMEIFGYTYNIQRMICQLNVKFD